MVNMFTYMYTYVNVAVSYIWILSDLHVYHITKSRLTRVRNCSAKHAAQVLEPSRHNA